MVLDNASAHVAKALKDRRDQLAKTGVKLFCLPPRSPELNDIERIWRSAKYEDHPAEPTPASKPSSPPWTRHSPSNRPATKDQQRTVPKPLRSA
ncbi:hypothetical protein A6A29_38130 [Streptomyces sp. TSRI0281]|nr:hypothetical protein A6A29_38130 [Streptomyces sp. TSRI0281]